MVKPIPKKLLIHELEYSECVGSNGWDKEFAEPINIKNVRVQPMTKLVESTNSSRIEATHIIMIDSKHSKPYIKPTEGSTIKWNRGNKDFEVIRVSEFYAFKDTPHHYEVEVK